MQFYSIVKEIIKIGVLIKWIPDLDPDPRIPDASMHVRFIGS